MQEQPELVGLCLVAGSAVGGEMVFECFDVVLGLAAGTVEPLVKLLGPAAFEIGEDVAGVGPLRADLDPGDDPLDPAPTPGGVVKFALAEI